MMTWPQMANDRLTLQDKMWSGGWKIERPFQHDCRECDSSHICIVFAAGGISYSRSALMRVKTAADDVGVSRQRCENSSDRDITLHNNVH
jgi:hypothetical protein